MAKLKIENMRVKGIVILDTATGRKTLEIDDVEKYLKTAIMAHYEHLGFKLTNDLIKKTIKRCVDYYDKDNGNVK